MSRTELTPVTSHDTQLSPVNSQQLHNSNSWQDFPQLPAHNSTTPQRNNPDRHLGNSLPSTTTLRYIHNWMPNPLQRQLSHESLSSHLLEVPSQLLKRHIQTLLTGCKKLCTSESSKTRLHKDHNESFPICPTTNWYLNLSKTKERNLKVKQLNKYEGKWKSNTKLKLYIRQKLAAFILTHIHAHHKDATQVHNHTTLINGLLTWSMASLHDTFRIRIHSNTHVASEYILAHETTHFASEHILARDTLIC